MRKRGFTLIELLVVIAVIAVLMGILMPALSKARKQAQGAACMSQLKQWGVIWSIYTEDNNGRLPDVKNGAINGGNWNRGFWVTVLRSSWEKKPKLLLCPTAKKLNTNTGRGDNEAYGDFDKAYGFPNYKDVRMPTASYGMNLWANYVPAGISEVQQRKRENHWQRLMDVKRPAEVPMFLDSMWRGGGPFWENANAIRTPRKNGDWMGAGYEMMHFALQRHARGVNCLFSEGSVRNVKTQELWELKWHKNYDTKRVTFMSASWWGDWLGGGAK